MTDVNGDLYATNVGLGTRVGVALSEHAFGAGQRRGRGNLLLAVVIGWRTCHNNSCKAPIYCAARPGRPPRGRVTTARAHPPRGAGRLLISTSFSSTISWDAALKVEVFIPRTRLATWVIHSCRPRALDNYELRCGRCRL